MHKKIYWYCFKRQCREFYELLTLYNLISCSLDEFMSHFTGKKFYDDDIKPGEIINWHGSKKLFNDTAFKYSDKPEVKSKDYYKSLCKLFPETTGYRCKTRLFYKERNKMSMKELLKVL
jgi:hypothetical protein